MNKQEMQKVINHLTMLRRLDSGEKKCLYDLAISALEQQLNGGWIPVSERWPDKTGYYLVTYHEWTDGNYLPKYDDTRVKILRYQEAVFRLPVCCDKEAEQDTHREIVAWQPLPEPYKEVSE